MQISFRYSHVDHSPSLEEHATGKLENVAHLVRGYEEQGAEVRAEVEFRKETGHHRSGDVFHVRLRLRLPRETVEADGTGEDPYVATDRARDVLHGAVLRVKEQDVARRHGED